ncbi:amino acid ABC transporter substrate-binding protein [Brevibacillus sp. 7WMA2]|uniref:amino acid ABC transporter substrate-binding protein n=1 Tax=Brevibacillus sp. 7WMA2 TaxID=2683193 RepID=UPI0013A78AA2|nr:amino acid ABC transporter substrate-binding protein [Brevibacillus sp. 7WMA2]QIC05900.1 amino acid ABC transporter substrate-binding protein [Brevibacillus sp. 7WMA2]WPS86821.1 amino acid ABC transporter substrate-binding protein [Brevibacillus halotolerans]
MKKAWYSTALVSILALSLFVAGCGSSNQGATGGQGGNTTAKNSLEAIKTAGKIRIGTEGTYAPFTYHDSTGQLTGFDVEIAREVAKRLGVEPEFIESKWDGMIAGLEANRFEMVVNEVGIRPDRKEKFDFSDPYIVSKAVLIVNEDNNEIKTFADLKGKKSAQTLTSNLTDLARENGAEIVQSEGFNQAIELLLSKRVDATVNDGLSFLDFKKQKPDVKIKIAAEHPNATENAMMFAKGKHPELIEAVNKALKEMKADGTYLKISEKYFGADVSK